MRQKNLPPRLKNIFEDVGLFNTVRFKIFARFLAVTLLVGIFVILLGNFEITKIECFDQYGMCPPEIYTAVEGIDNKKFISYKKQIINKLSENKRIEKIFVRFKFPQTFEISISLRSPKYSVVNTTTGEIYEVDERGTVLRKVESSNLPSFYITDPVFRNDRVDEKTLFGLDILKALYFLYQTKSISMKEGFAVTDIEGYRVVFPLEGDKERTLGALRLIISRLNKIMEDSRIVNVSTIDLRFRNPVLR